MSFHVFYYLGQNEQNERNEVVNHLAITKWLTKTTAHPRRGKFKFSHGPLVSFQSIFAAIVFFLFHIPIILIIPFLTSFFPEETKKTHPKPNGPLSF